MLNKHPDHVCLAGEGQSCNRHLIPVSKRPLLPLADYQRIYQIIYSVLEASDSARTHRACSFFASVGALILREHYGLKATISMGRMALMVDEAKANVVVYGRQKGDEWVYDSNGFHAWVECDGWLIDFMAPIMGVALKEDGIPFNVPSKMLQKRLEDRQPHLHAIQLQGEFFCAHDPALANDILEGQGLMFQDLVGICMAWFRKPPKPLPSIGMGGNGIDAPKPLVLKAPAIIGVW
jgi:hypothetical protein